MGDTKSITRFIEKRTYLTGSFKGKYIGILDPSKSDMDHKAFYDIEVLEGEIKTSYRNLTKWTSGGEPSSFESIERFLTKLPNPIACEISYPDGVVKCYKLDLKEPKLANYRLYNQVYEKDTVFGTIEGEISGFLLHYIPEEVEVQIAPESPELEHTSEETETLTNIATGKPETNGNYSRRKIFLTNGETRWGNWEYNNLGDSKYSFWSMLRTFISWLFLPLFFIPLLLLGARFIIPMLIIAGISYIFNFFKPFISALFGLFSRLLILGLFIGFIVGLINLIKLSRDYRQKVNSKDESTETTVVETSPVFRDSLISHHRVWTDYNEKRYETDIKIRYKDFRNSTGIRTQANLVINSTEDYTRLVRQITNFDINKLDLLYKELDSLKAKNNLDQNQFAEVITSCVQDIPYTLILDQDCDSRLYNDDFIRSYLNDGGKCQGDVKYGLYTPVEFLATLDGDCDTRTLLLFTILNHYNYDVAMLCSEMYKHSIIAINLPIQGISKYINGKSYIVWETTSKGAKPGLIPPDISNMRYWNVVLTSNPISS